MKFTYSTEFLPNIFHFDKHLSCYRRVWSDCCKEAFFTYLRHGSLIFFFRFQL